MRTIVAWTLTLVVGAWTSGRSLAQEQQTVQPTPKRSTPPAAARPAAAATVAPQDEKALQQAFIQANNQLNALLEEWEAQSKKITSLDVEFERVDHSPGFGDEIFRGRAMLKSPDLACLEFTKVILDANQKPVMVSDKEGKPTKKTAPQPNERILCTGKEVLQYAYDEKVVRVFPLDKQVRQKTLQQGPLPFLFNMKAAEAKKRYTMAIMKQDSKEYLIEILPNEEIDKQSFERAYLWLSKTTFLPNKLRLQPIGKEKQDFFFVGDRNRISPNVPMNDQFFAFAKAPEGWKMMMNPGGEPGNGVQANPAPTTKAQTKQAVVPSNPRTKPR